MKAFQIKRLLKLADFLDELPRQKFNFATIFYQGDKPPMEALKAGAHKCGTVGCAIGWAPAALPRLFEWKMSVNEYEPEKGPQVDSVRCRATDTDDFRAAVDVFGMSFNEVVWLFSPLGQGGSFDGRYRHSVGAGATPKQVARHIRKFVARKQEAPTPVVETESDEW